MIPLDINKITTEIDFQIYISKRKKYTSIDEWLFDPNPYSKWNITETDKLEIKTIILKLQLFTDIESKDEIFRLNRILECSN